MKNNVLPSRRAWRVPRTGWVTALAAAGAAATGQDTTEFLTTQIPYPAYQPMTQDHYNLRWGRMTARLDGSVGFGFIDNRFYSETDREPDFSIYPKLNVGIFFPINERTELQFDIGLGYSWWANNDELNGFFITPSSHLDYQLTIGQVLISLSDDISTTSNPTSRPEFAGSPGVEVDFQRIYNIAAVDAQWQPGKYFYVSGGYNFQIDQSINGSEEFNNLNRTQNNFSGGIYSPISDLLTVGIAGNYSFFDYSENIQNDGQSWGVGPNVTWRPLRSLSVNLGVSYTVMTFEPTGTITDTSEFDGLTFNLGVTHQINERMNQSLGAAHSVNPGSGANFTESYYVNYQFTYRLSRRITLNTGINYANIITSGTTGTPEPTNPDGGVPGEEANLIQFTLGTGYEIARRVNVGFNYNFGWRDSDLPGRNYTVNSVNVLVSYQF